MGTFAEINLNNLVFNANAVKKRLSEGVKLCAVVKADAYGHGAVECANALYNIADWFAVATVKEGVKLKNAGIDKDVLILTPAEKPELRSAIENDLVLSVSSFNGLKEIKREAERQDKKATVHIAFNTGMNRLGIDGIAELKKLLRYANSSKNVIVGGLFSHFACPENKKAREKALNEFLLAKTVVKGYNNNAICHISASGGFLAGVYEDMVRIGILLYGYKPFKSDIRVRPVMEVYSSVVKKRVLSAGDFALYGRKKTKVKKNISIVSYGYADGLFRSEIKGQFNNRCMDLTALEGNGKRNKIYIMKNADLLAKKYKTISYEILVKVAIRAEKIYIR